jgi:hypothetical protein
MFLLPHLATVACAAAASTLLLLSLPSVDLLPDLSRSTPQPTVSREIIDDINLTLRLDGLLDFVNDPEQEMSVSKATTRIVATDAFDNSKTSKVLLQ